MSEAYIPYAPLDTLKPIAVDVWIVDGPEIRMGYLGMKVPFSTRMTIVRLPDGAIWIHSRSRSTRRWRTKSKSSGALPSS